MGSASVNTNTYVTFTAVNPGGVPEVSYSWAAPGGAPATGNSNSFTTKWSTSGAKAVNVALVSSNVCFDASASSRSVTVTAPVTYTGSSYCENYDKSLCKCSSGTPHTYLESTPLAQTWAMSQKGDSFWDTWATGTGALPCHSGYAGFTTCTWARLICY